MKKMLALLLMLPAVALADSYDPVTNQLTIDTVSLPGDPDVVYKNVVVTLGNVVSPGQMVSMRGARPIQCSEKNFSNAIVSGIKTGMTLSQVNAVMGCTATAAPLMYNTPQTICYTWSIGPFSQQYSGRAAWVYIDRTTQKVGPMFGEEGGGFYAGWAGF
ncbi:hypothetical protein [Parachitinimonas caeni]|uniref:Uncharacterized protein n=1 Tax=Parachitinimonas caeni TaxID=3031301 RepID=A0ABT7E189_9NEIS|nr:hypothetical protein [Parachitinimonas caeni]MDK2125093.1 hypothetical protein [Parachitinimonas caeni]